MKYGRRALRSLVGLGKRFTQTARDLRSSSECWRTDDGLRRNHSGAGQVWVKSACANGASEPGTGRNTICRKPSCVNQAPPIQHRASTATPYVAQMDAPLHPSHQLDTYNLPLVSLGDSDKDNVGDDGTGKWFAGSLRVARDGWHRQGKKVRIVNQSEGRVPGRAVKSGLSFRFYAANRREIRSILGREG